MQWCEGKVFEAFLLQHRILRLDELPGVTRDEYLGGVLDFTGELNRHAVKCATARDIPAVQQCRDVVDALMGIFLEVRSLLRFSLGAGSAWVCASDAAGAGVACRHRLCPWRKLTRYAMRGRYAVRVKAFTTQSTIVCSACRYCAGRQWVQVHPLAHCTCLDAHWQRRVHSRVHALTADWAGMPCSLISGMAIFARSLTA